MQGAIKLLQQLFAELPEPSELATAHVQMAECLMAMDQRENALNAYRTALRVEKEFPQRRTNAWLDFPWLVVTKRMRQLYSEARSFLEWGNRQPRFPIEEYKLATVEAFMAEDEGSVGTAKRFARIALNVAQRTHSGFRYHPTLGLVKDQEQEVKERLEKLAR